VSVIVFTTAKLNALKARHKPYKASDFDGLYVLVNPTGSKLWRFKYRFAGKEKLLSFGRYPDLGLKTVITSANGQVTLTDFDGTLLDASDFSFF